MQIRKANEQDRAAITALLQAENLPFEDLPLPLQNFYVAMEEDKLAGLIGMGRYGEAGLLRSMVVHPAYRNRQIAGKLVQLLEEEAKASGVGSMYLLTETAEKYSSRKGYNTISRGEVPPLLMQSSEFSHLCPVSATVMKKALTANPVQAV